MGAMGCGQTIPHDWAPGRDAVWRPAPATDASPDAQGPHAVAPIGGIIFDMADVLYDDTLWRRGLLRIVNRLGLRARYEEFYRTWDRDYLVDVYRGRREYAEALQSFLLAWGLSWAQVDEVEAASRIQRENLDRSLRPLPGVVKTILELSERGLPLLAWSDACQPAASLAKKLERLTLGNCFRAVLSSCDLQCAQPSPRCYQAAVDALGLAVDQALYVGHDAEHLAGAQAAGLRTVAFNFPPGARADYYLTQFEDLLVLAKPGSILPPARSPQGAVEARRPPASLATEGNHR